MKESFKKKIVKVALITMCILAAFVDILFSQPFINGAVGVNKELFADFNAGYMTEIKGFKGFRISIGANVSGASEAVKHKNISIGQNIIVTNWENDRYISFIPSIGIAFCKRDDFSKYDGVVLHATITEEKTVDYIAGMELGYSQKAGRFFVVAKYCKSPYFGVGFGVLFK